MKARKAVMVLKYEPALTHSVWMQFHHRCRSVKSLRRLLREMTKAGDIVGYRLITIHEQVIGIDPPLTDREFQALEKRRATREAKAAA